jgi:hypothetical protein
MPSTTRQHISLTPVAAGEAGSGFVENIHANGPNIYAHEQYSLNNGSPSTTYEVVIHLSAPADTTCSAPFLVLTTASFTTNVAGNGSANHVFTPTDAGPLRGATWRAYWTLETPGRGGIHDKLRDHRARLILRPIRAAFYSSGGPQAGGGSGEPRRSFSAYTVPAERCLSGRRSTSSPQSAFRLREGQATIDDDDLAGRKRCASE